MTTSSVELERVAGSAPSTIATRVTQTTAVEQARAVAEVQAAVTVAQQCPRDIGKATAEMEYVCSRMSLAQRAFYSVPRKGGKPVAGKSIHLARELARIWGNSVSGVRELHRDDESGMSEILAYAWDQQSNHRTERSFQVPHVRMVTDKVSGRKSRVPLEDTNEVYLNNQNIGARALRECIFAELPDWFVEDAARICEKTLRDGEGKPLPQRVADMVAAFKGVRVSEAMMESKLEKKRSQWGPDDLALMAVVFTSIRDGDSTVADEFPSDAVDVTADILGGAQ